MGYPMAAVYFRGVTLRECVNLWLETTGDQKQDIAERGGLAPTKLSEIISGSNHDPRLKTLEKLAKGFGVSLAEFLAGPRPEQDSGHAERRAVENNPVFQALLERRDQKTPAEDSVRGDILRAQDALGEAAAALNRALRRADNPGDSGAPPAAARR